MVSGSEFELLHGKVKEISKIDDHWMLGGDNSQSLFSLGNCLLTTTIT